MLGALWQRRPPKELPHYHRRGLDLNGDTIPGQGIGRHRPWETKSANNLFGMGGKSMTLELPLIICAFGDISIFYSVSEAECYYEPFDIHSLIGFDSQGKELEFTLRKEIKKVIGIPTEVEKIVISIKANDVDEEKLRTIIIEYLRRVRSVNRQPFIQRDWNKLSLTSLINIIKEISQFEKDKSINNTK